MVNIIETDGLRKTYRVGRSLGRKKPVINAVNGVDIRIQKGRTVGLVGESGCGKSTLGRMILGLEEPTAGNVRVTGRSAADFTPAELAKHIQPIFQDPFTSLNPRKKIGTIIGLPLHLHTRLSTTDIKHKVASFMELVGLPAALMKRYPSQLSGGQRQRVAIARALILEPDVVICDEPTSALDVSAQSQVLNLLVDLREKLNVTYLFISHDLSVINYIADYVVVMYKGRVVEEGESDEVLANPRHPYTRLLLRSVLTPDTNRALPSVEASDHAAVDVDADDGCSFYPRCPNRMNICKTIIPHARQANGIRVACHLYDADQTSGALDAASA